MHIFVVKHNYKHLNGFHLQFSMVLFYYFVSIQIYFPLLVIFTLFPFLALFYFFLLSSLARLIFCLQLVSFCLSLFYFELIPLYHWFTLLLSFHLSSSHSPSFPLSFVSILISILCLLINRLTSRPISRTACFSYGLLPLPPVTTVGLRNLFMSRYIFSVPRSAVAATATAAAAVQMFLFGI